MLNNICLRSSSNKKSGTTAVSKGTNKKTWKHGKMPKNQKCRSLFAVQNDNKTGLIIVHKNQVIKE